MIRIFQKDSSPELEASALAAALRLRVLRLLAQCLELNLLPGRGLDTESLKADLEKLLFNLENSSSEAAVMESSASVCSGLQHYFRHLDASIESMAGELSVGIHSLEQLLAELRGQQQSNLRRFEDITGHYSATRNFDDVHALQQHFDNCLHVLREEVRQQRSAAGRNQAAFAEALSTLRSLAGPAPRLFAVLQLRHLERVRERFGSDIVDSMLKLLREQLRARWNSAESIEFLRSDALLVLDPVDLDLERRRTFLRRLQAERLVLQITLEAREYLLPLHFDWIADLCTSQADLQRRCERFLASPLGPSAG